MRLQCDICVSHGTGAAVMADLVRRRIARETTGRQDTSLNSAMDDSDSDGGEATRYGQRSGRSSPSYSDTSKRSEDSIRSYDGWRNGAFPTPFATRHVSCSLPADLAPSLCGRPAAGWSRQGMHFALRTRWE